MTAAIVLLLSSQLAAEQATPRADPWESVPLKRISEIDLPPSTLEGKWKASAGLRIEDLSKPKDVPSAQRQLVDSLEKQLSPIGVRSAADFTLVKTELSLNTVTVRLFVFIDAEKCRAWWKKKYEYEGWQEHYEKIECHAAVAVSSLQINKCAMAFGNVWLTTHQLQKGDEHIKAANQILKRLTEGKRSLTKR